MTECCLATGHWPTCCNHDVCRHCYYCYSSLVPS